MRKALIYAPFILLAILFACLSLQGDASATGGAFPYTKHGGGTTDGVTPYNAGSGPGVDRSVNSDYGSYYHDQSSESGKYKGGECTHCHEPHAKFGGSEAPPDSGGDAGPDDYLAFKEYGTSANFAELCWYCHDSMQLNGNPPSYGYWDFYQGSSIFQNSSHYISNNFYWPGTSGDPVQIWPRRDRSSLPAGNTGSCLNCHTPHGIKSGGSGSAFDTTSPDGSGGVPASMQTVASGNLSVNADYLIPRQLIAWEETLCENCHDSNGPAPNSNIQGEINKRGNYTGSGTTDGSGGSGHLVDYTNIAGRHTAEESTVLTRDTTNGDIKHVECYDCHNPHAVTGNGSNGTSAPGSTNFNRLAGMKFVRCDTGDCSGTATDPYSMGRDPNVHEVCFRCHGDGWSDFFESSKIFPENTQSRPPGLSNKRKEFSPDYYDGSRGPNQNFNSAYHPVAAPGRNTSLAMCLSLQSAFSLNCSSASAAANSLSSLTINCTDCHNTEDTGGISGPVTESNLRTTDRASGYGGSSPVGPHGSRVSTPSLNFASGTSDSGDRSILRDYYFTGTLSNSNRPFNAPSGSAEFQNRFRLCFNCHDWDPFFDGNNANTGFYNDGGGGGGGMGGGGMGGGGMGGPANLHAFHLNGAGGGMMWNSTYEACMTCHYNIHSNVQATNTNYGTIAPDGDTHLINFAPGVVTGGNWYYDGSGMYCSLVCHGATMAYGYSCTHAVTNGENDTCEDY